MPGVPSEIGAAARTPNLTAPVSARPCAHWLALALLVAALPARAAAPTEPMIEFEVQRADTLIGLSRDVLVTPDA